MRATRSIGRLALLMFLVSGLATVGVLARPGGGRFGPPDPEARLERMAERLDLSEAQREALKDLFETNREAREAGREQMRAAREELAARIHADVLDEAAIRGAAGAVAALEADHAVARARSFQQLREILTPEQLEEFRAMRERHHEMRMEHRRGGFHGRGPGGPRGGF